jgi:Transposase C of IS166 homeodomain
MSADDSLPDDVEALKNLLRARDAELARARAEASSAEALIAHLRLAIEKMRRELYGRRTERKARLLDQMELELKELEAAAAEDELAAGKAADNPVRFIDAFVAKLDLVAAGFVHVKKAMGRPTFGSHKLVTLSRSVCSLRSHALRLSRVRNRCPQAPKPGPGA